MFSAKNTDNPNPFRPALQYLLAAGRSQSPAPRSTYRKTSFSDSLDSDGEDSRPKMSFLNSNTPHDSGNAAIPLINLSRTPSPLPPRQRPGSNTASETEEEDDWGDQYSLQRPFLSQGGTKLTGWARIVHGGGFGEWLFTTNRGWQLYIAVLVLWLGGCQIGLTIMNRIILWSGYLKDNYTQHTKLMVLIAGVYKFPYPLTTTLFELIISHFFVLLSAYITRWVGPWLTNAGVAGMIAPSGDLPSSSSPGFRGRRSGASRKWARSRFSGIAGGGFFEFEWQVAKHVLPAAIIFVAKVMLSNLSFAYAQLPIYVLARIGIVPISLVLSAFLSQQSHSVSTISSALIATLALLVAISAKNIRAPWEAVVTGVFSSFFVALYPVQLQRTYRILLASLVPQGEILTNHPYVNANLPPDHSGSREETRAYWRLLHYTSVLSIIILLPFPFLTGEAVDIARNCYILDVFFHWLMVLCGGCGSWAVFWATIALTRATSPLTTTFLFIPRAAFLLPIMAGFKMPPHSWVGIGMCWASCALFWRSKMKDGRMLGGLR
jgi:hypothetical protein